jgi:hypothetical protein
MSKLLRNLVIGAVVAVAAGLAFGLLGAMPDSEAIGNLRWWLAGTLGILAFFMLHLLGGNVRTAPADAAARAQALSFACPPDRSLIYFVRTGFTGKAVGVDIAIDGKTVSQIKSPSFTCLALAPGAHEFEARVGKERSALCPGSARLSATLVAGSATLLHIAIQRGKLESQ